MGNLINKNALKINNNPLMFSGRIGRLIYFITTFSAYLLAAGINYLTKTFYSTSLIIPLFIVGLTVLLIIPFFAAIKRLRDINVSIWFALLLFIPYVSIIGHILLICIKSYYDKVPLEDFNKEVNDTINDK